MQISITALADKIATEHDAYLFLEELRWGDKPVCPHCGNDERAHYLKPKNGTTRKTRTGAPSQRRVWFCGACRKQFSVLTGTIFHGSKISVRKWLFVFFEMCSSKNGVSAREIERKYALTPKSAWFMLHRIRESMKRDPFAGLLAGIVVADEAFIGGRPANKHRQGRPVRIGGAGGTAHMTPVLSLVNKTTGEVRSRVIPDVTSATIRKVLSDEIALGESHLQTDAASHYRSVGQEFESHQWVDHGHYEYVRGEVTTNHAEGYFSQLKRSIDGTHHHVSREHLDRYLAEFDYRYSTRKLSDTARMQKLMGQTAGRRLTYRPATGR